MNYLFWVMVAGNRLRVSAAWRALARRAITVAGSVQHEIALNY